MIKSKAPQTMKSINNTWTLNLSDMRKVLFIFRSSQLWRRDCDGMSRSGSGVQGQGLPEPELMVPMSCPFVSLVSGKHLFCDCYNQHKYTLNLQVFKRNHLQLYLVHLKKLQFFKMDIYASSVFMEIFKVVWLTWLPSSWQWRHNTRIQ